VFTGTTCHADPDGGGIPRFGYIMADRRVTAYYFYLRNCRSKPVTSTAACSTLCVSVRALSLPAQPVSGWRDQPSRMVGGPQPCGSATHALRVINHHVNNYIREARMTA
jgi:hypothetical protein